MADHRFEVRLHKSAQKEYARLDNTVVQIVDKALEELGIRADEIGKPLGKKRNINLTGRKEIKLRDAGIRIVFTVTKQYVQVLQIVVVLAEDRTDDIVFRLAGERFYDMKAGQKTEKQT